MDYEDIELSKIDAFVNLEGKQVLEVGCGDGRLSTFLAREAENLIAVDPDETRIEVARQAVKGVDFHIGSGESLEFPEDSFDLVFFGFSLHHHQDGFAALSEARRVLKPGGDILIIEPTIMSEYTQLVAIFEKEEPALLRKAQKAIEPLNTAISRQETFVVYHYFETEEDFLNHYTVKYGGGIGNNASRQALRRIIGDKRFTTPICVDDECTIALISGKTLAAHTV
jgi:ubiquinone/menaquinone biosynthesis C-methylase UbiE